MRIGIIGSGHIGGTLARHFVAAGHEVAVSNSRGPETLAELVAGLGTRAQAVTAEEAARFGDLVVVSVPFGRYRELPTEGLAGKVVIDTNNYYPERDGQIAELDDESTTTSELLQAHLPGSKVVKAFNHIMAADITADAAPAGTEGRRALAVAGDDTEAMATVAALIEQLGFDVVDLGPLAQGWRVQRDTPGYVTRLDREELAEAARSAQRYRDMS